MADAEDQRFVAPSLPALGWQLRTGALPPAHVEEALHTLHQVVQAWRVQTPSIARDPAAEVAAATHAVRHAADRLRRLAAAYGEWATFDAAAYFDLTPDQSALLIETVVRVTAVHVTFYADLLLPSFQRAVAWWADEYAPAVAVLQGDADLPLERAEHFAAVTRATMAARWQAAAAVIKETRRQLAGDIGFLAANGANEERLRWRGESLRASLPTLLDLSADLERTGTPTLTLTFDFPRPARQQPGRQRRLRRTRARNILRSRRQAHGRRGTTL